VRGEQARRAAAGTERAQGQDFSSLFFILTASKADELQEAPFLADDDE